MKAQPDDSAVIQLFGARCAGCTPGSGASTDQLGEKHGFGVLILPDDLRVFSAGG